MAEYFRDGKPGRHNFMDPNGGGDPIQLEEGEIYKLLETWVKIDDANYPIFYHYVEMRSKLKGV